MRRARCLLMVPLCLLLFCGVARAGEKYYVRTAFEGELLSKTSMTVDAHLVFREPSGCVFEESEGNLVENAVESKVEFRFPHLAEGELCPSYEGRKDRFYRIAITAASGINTELESNAVRAKIKFGACLYGIEKMNGAMTVPGMTVAEVTGEGVLKSGPAECGTVGVAKRTFEAELQILNEGEPKKSPPLSPFWVSHE